MIHRRAFLRMLGLGTAAAAVPVIAEPVRRVWQVPSNAPVLGLEHAKHVCGPACQLDNHADDTGALFGIDPRAYPEWKANLYSAASLTPELFERFVGGKYLDAIGNLRPGSPQPQTVTVYEHGAVMKWSGGHSEFTAQWSNRSSSEHKRDIGRDIERADLVENLLANGMVDAKSARDLLTTGRDARGRELAWGQISQRWVFSDDSDDSGWTASATGDDTST